MNLGQINVTRNVGASGRLLGRFIFLWMTAGVQRLMQKGKIGNMQLSGGSVL